MAKVNPAPEGMEMKDFPGKDEKPDDIYCERCVQIPDPAFGQSGARDADCCDLRAWFRVCTAKFAY